MTMPLDQAIQTMFEILDGATRLAEILNHGDYKDWLEARDAYRSETASTDRLGPLASLAWRHMNSDVQASLRAAYPVAAAMLDELDADPSVEWEEPDPVA